MAIKSLSKKRLTRKPSTRDKSNANKVIDAIKPIIDRKNPYCYGGTGQELNASNKSKVQSLAKSHQTGHGQNDTNYYHILGSDKDKYGKNWNWTMSASSTEYQMFDCSGLTNYVYKKALGKSLGGSAKDQRANAQKTGTEVPLSQAHPGDLIWRKTGSGGNHVGIVGTDPKYAFEAQGWYYGCTSTRKVESSFHECYHLTGDSYDPNYTEGSGEDPDVPDPGGNEPDPVVPVTEDLLDEAQERSAIVYNKKNNQSICKEIQGVVGVYPDGNFGTETVQAIARWQANHNLTADGKFGDKSKAAAGIGNSSAPQGGTTEQVNIVLTAAQTQSAISYNKRNNQSICQQIQNLVGVTPDGIFGTMTVNAIANWQAKNNLTADGKFGPMSRSVAGF